MAIDLLETRLFVLQVLAVGRRQHLVDEALQHGLRLLVLDQRSGVEVDPIN